MIWQDMVIAGANVLINISLVPEVIKGFKTKTGYITRATSIPIVISLYAIAYSFYTLALWFSAAMTFISGSLWLILMIQRFVFKKA